MYSKVLDMDVSKYKGIAWYLWSFYWIYRIDVHKIYIIKKKSDFFLVVDIVLVLQVIFSHCDLIDKGFVGHCIPTSGHWMNKQQRWIGAQHWNITQVHKIWERNMDVELNRE